MSEISKILEVCRRIKNGRSFMDVANAVDSERNELYDEITFHIRGEEGGNDGVIGEGVDVILCIIDLMYQYSPNITADFIDAVIERKLTKWESLYGTAEKAAETISKKG